MAVWTTPRTWSTGELVTAAIMNQHVRDNLTTLASPIATNIAGLNSLYGGTPPDGARGTLIMGASPYTKLDLVYSASYAHWISEELHFGTTSNGTQIGGANAAGTHYDGNAWTGFSYVPASNGCTLQVRGTGVISGTGNPDLTYGQIALYAYTLGGATGSTTINIGSGPQNTSTFVAINWTPVGYLGGYDIAVGGMCIYNNANDGYMSSPTVAARWIG